MRLDTKDHDRDAAGFEYVYPVVSRRARGVSVGINLNPNNACNWRCAYCQVPGLVRGAAPPIDLSRLRVELRSLLNDVVHGEFMQRVVPEGSRRLNDIAFSGNGEPTTSKQFDEVVALTCEVLAEFDLAGTTKLVLITNGSLIDRPHVQRGLAQMSANGGEVWFKLDSATPEGQKRINDSERSLETAAKNLDLAASLCRTRIQTCLLAMDDEPPSEAECAAYLAFLSSALTRGTQLADVLLYGLERSSHQPEGPRLSKLEPEWLETFADRVREIGLPVQVHP